MPEKFKSSFYLSHNTFKYQVKEFVWANQNKLLFCDCLIEFIRLVKWKDLVCAFFPPFFGIVFVFRVIACEWFELCLW